MEEWSESQEQLLQLTKHLNYVLHHTDMEPLHAGDSEKLYLDNIRGGSFHKLLGGAEKWSEVPVAFSQVFLKPTLLPSVVFV